jgi:hypothetical protein
MDFLLLLLLHLSLLMLASLLLLASLPYGVFAVAINIEITLILGSHVIKKEKNMSVQIKDIQSMTWWVEWIDVPVSVVPGCRARQMILKDKVQYLHLFAQFTEENKQSSIIYDSLTGLVPFGASLELDGKGFGRHVQGCFWHPKNNKNMISSCINMFVSQLLGSANRYNAHS